eukprot:4734403-Pyramimonas_sp.AAC.1
MSRRGRSGSAQMVRPGSSPEARVMARTPSGDGLRGERIGPQSPIQCRQGPDSCAQSKSVRIR